jgi:hypothetical protein
VTALGAAVREGRAKPEELAREIWAPYEGQETCCFLCDAPVVLPACIMCVPDRRNMMLATPLCGACAALPPMVQLHRGLRLMRKMSGVAR